MRLVLAADGCGVALDGLGDAKIDELELPRHQQEVGGLQVRVHDARLVDRVHSLQIIAITGIFQEVLTAVSSDTQSWRAGGPSAQRAPCGSCPLPAVSRCECQATSETNGLTASGASARCAPCGSCTRPAKIAITDDSQKLPNII